MEQADDDPVGGIARAMRDAGVPAERVDDAARGWAELQPKIQGSRRALSRHDKGWELRLVVLDPAAEDELERLLGLLGIQPGRTFLKRGRRVYPIYGEAHQWLAALFGREPPVPRAARRWSGHSPPARVLGAVRGDASFAPSRWRGREVHAGRCARCGELILVGLDGALLSAGSVATVGEEAREVVLCRRCVEQDPDDYAPLDDGLLAPRPAFVPRAARAPRPPPSGPPVHPPDAAAWGELEPYLAGAEVDRPVFVAEGIVALIRIEALATRLGLKLGAPFAVGHRTAVPLGAIPQWLAHRFPPPPAPLRRPRAAEREQAPELPPRPVGPRTPGEWLGAAEPVAAHVRAHPGWCDACIAQALQLDERLVRRYASTLRFHGALTRHPRPCMGCRARRTVNLLVGVEPPEAPPQKGTLADRYNVALQGAAEDRRRLLGKLRGQLAVALERVFGPLPAGLADALESAGEARLDEIAARLRAGRTLEEVVGVGTLGTDAVDAGVQPDDGSPPRKRAS